MNDIRSLLSFATDPAGDVVHIYADAAGLELLRRTVTHLLDSLAKGRVNHDHLFSPDWAGQELTTTMPENDRDSGFRQVHHVKIYALTDEARESNGL